MVENSRDNAQLSPEEPINSADSPLRTVSLSAPRPLTETEFEKVCVWEYLQLMDEAEFQSLFNQEPTPDAILTIIHSLQDWPEKLMTDVNQFMHKTIKHIQNTSLDGKPEVAWTIVERFAQFSQEDLQYISYMDDSASNLKSYIKMRLSQISGLSMTIDFIETVDQANQISSTRNQPVSMKNAEKIYNKLRNYEPNLDAEQKSAIYFLSSEVFRQAQSVPGIYTEPNPCDKEIFCLKMVLENTSNISLADCCHDRMSRDKTVLKANTPLLISAYKRILSKRSTVFPEDDYRINSKIATLYQNSVNRSSPGFSSIQLDDYSKLRWAEYFYGQAYKKAPTKIKKSEALFAISAVQKSLGEKQKSSLTYKKAISLLPIPERFEKALDFIATGDESDTLAQMQEIIPEISKCKLQQGIKKILYDKALLIAKQKLHNPTDFSSVENLVPNTILTPNTQIVRNSSTHE